MGTFIITTIANFVIRGEERPTIRAIMYPQDNQLVSFGTATKN